MGTVQRRDRMPIWDRVSLNAQCWKGRLGVPSVTALLSGVSCGDEIPQGSAVAELFPRVSL